MTRQLNVRPWGTWEILLEEPRYKVKRLELNPEGSISLQRHRERSEFWVIVSGKGCAIVGDRETMVTVESTVFVPLLAWHRLSNTGAEPLVIIETQIGSCDEKDIERKEDKYGRT